jgi:RimJ/RimL family protein N-acetyltransferase
VNPILLNLPEEYETERLTIRFPRPGDGTAIQAAFVEAGDHIYKWVPWANPKLTVEEVEERARKRLAKVLTRELFWFHTYLKGTSTLVGEAALHHVEWEVPKFEIGYYVRPCFEGQGYASEAVEWITRFAFDCLGAQRIEIWCDNRNERSWRVAERAGFTLEGIMRKQRRDEVDGTLVDKRVYAKIRMDNQTQQAR